MVCAAHLNRTDTMELPILVAISGFLAAICFPFSKISAAILGFPAFAIVCYWVFTGFQNQIRRFLWSRSFDGRWSRRTALNRIRMQPEKFVLYVQYDSGGFDRTHLAPAAILEHTENSKRIAIYPTSWKIVADCKNLKVLIRDSQGKSFPN